MSDIVKGIQSRIQQNNHYEIIYVDPPWQYTTTQKGNRGVAENHYSTMTLADLKALSIGSIAANNCALFLWATMPCLPEALDVIKAWGFKYKTVAFTWVKRNKKNDRWFIGLGHYTRSNAELCLLATKGKPKTIDRSISSIIDTRREAHSKKPDIARELIVELMGPKNRIELFARQRIYCWDSIGDEI